MKFIFLPFFLLVSSCSYIELVFNKPKKSKVTSSKNYTLSPRQKLFFLTDKSGEFLQERSSAFKQKTRELIVKGQVFPTNQDIEKPLERFITISKAQNKSDFGYLRPVVSQFSVWFDGQKYFSEIRFSKDLKKATIKMKSPERKWNGEREIEISKNNKAFCFFTQVIECAHYMGFLKKSKSSNSGTMNFSLIWDGYPYFQEQYLNIPNEIISNASLSYDGKSDEGLVRYKLNVGRQVLFFMVDRTNRLAKKFWVSQGFSLIQKE